MWVILISTIILSGCAQVNEETEISTSSEDSIAIFKLGSNNDVFEEDDPQYYYASPESITTVFVRDTEEESFEHDTELLNFERTETGFVFTYLNYKDEETTKEFEIKSSSIVEDEKGIWYEWNGPEEWTASE